MRFYIDSSDLIAYVVIAENYLKYDLINEANSHWSPLISILLIPVNFCFENHFTAFHFLQLLIGFFCVAQCNKIMIKQQLPVIFQLPAQVILSVLIVYYGQLWGTPDLLFLTVLLWGLNRLISMNKSEVLTGFIFGLLFLAKSFGMVLFGAILLTDIALNFLQNGFSVNQLLRSIKFAAGFLVVASFWIIILNQNQNRFTVSTATDYNFDIMNPVLNPNPFDTMKHPALLDSLIPPSNDHSLFYWTTPFSFKMEPWRPWQTKDNTRHYLQIVKRNLFSLMSFYFGKDGGSLFVLILMVSLIKYGRKMFNAFNVLQIFIAASLLTCILYLLILVNHRYVWIADITLVFCFFGLMFDLLIKKWYVATSLLTGLFAALVLFEPCHEVYCHAYDGKKELASIASLKDMQNWSSDRFCSVKGNEQFENYTRSALICYYLNSKYYGMISSDIFSERGVEMLIKNKIRYVITYEPLRISSTDEHFIERIKTRSCNVYEFRAN